MESDFEAKVGTLTEAYHKSLFKANLGSLQKFDSSKYLFLKLVVISTDIQHYSSTSISGSGGGGRIRQGVGGTTGRMSNINISSNVEHHVKNEAWVIGLDNNNEFKIDFPADFDVREGHTVLVLGFDGGQNGDFFITERFVNLSTNQTSVAPQGVFNNLTIEQTKKSSCILFFLSLLPIIGSLFSLNNLTCQHERIIYRFAKYRGKLYNRITNWLITLIVLPLVGYQFMNYALLAVNPLLIIGRTDNIGAVTAMLTPTAVLIFTLALKIKRKRRAKKYIILQSEYMDNFFSLYTEEIKENTDTLEKSKEVYMQTIVKPDQQSVSDVDTKECPECAEIIKLNAKKCRFCGLQLEN